MKRIVLLVVLVVALGGSAWAQSVLISLTNDTPSSPRLTTSAQFIRRASYTLDVNFRIAPGLPLDISGRTVELHWKPVNRLTDSPCPTVAGSVLNATGGTARVVIPPEYLNVVGDTMFSVTAKNATNRATVFWQSPVNEDPSQIADDTFIPGTPTNYYTQAQIDALLTNFLDKTVADGRFVNETNGLVSAWYVAPTSTSHFVAIDTTATNVQLVIESIDRGLANRYTRSQSDSNYVNHGEASSVDGSMIVNGTVSNADLSAEVTNRFLNARGNAELYLYSSASNFNVFSIYGSEGLSALQLIATNSIAGFYFNTPPLGMWSTNGDVVLFGGKFSGTNLLPHAYLTGLGFGGELYMPALRGEPLRWRNFLPTNSTHSASNYTIAVSGTNLFICWTNSWLGSGTNWGRLMVAPY